MTSDYRGRFAPSPTGPLHLGSLTTALASFLDAKKNNGKWLVRIEDIDRLREQPGATTSILKALEAHGLEWDEKVVCQSDRSDLYEEVISQLFNQGNLYYCPCSRKTLQQSHGEHSPLCKQYRNRTSNPFKTPTAIRAQVADSMESWEDSVLGRQKYSITSNRDDFIVKRKEGFYAYHLAVVADDIEQKITHIIRGEDLLDSTPAHLWLYKQLAHPAPFYGHTPLVKNELGQKLSKQNKAPSLDLDHPKENLLSALNLLGLRPERQIIDQPIASMLNWAKDQWSLNNLFRDQTNDD